ncbi:MAG: hypothetical protein AAFN30_11930, partial [Actinomycetota bacterium]
SAVESLCHQGIWLERGKLIDQGPIGEILRAYGRSLHESQVSPTGGDGLQCVRVATFDAGGRPAATFGPRAPIVFELTFDGPDVIEQRQVLIRITDGIGDDLIEAASPIMGSSPAGTTWTARCRIDSIPLNPRLYQIWGRVTDGGRPEGGMEWREVGAFRIERGDAARGCRPTSIGVPPVAVDADWSIGS